MCPERRPRRKQRDPLVTMGFDKLRTRRVCVVRPLNANHSGHQNTANRSLFVPAQTAVPITERVWNGDRALAQPGRGRRVNGGDDVTLKPVLWQILEEAKRPQPADGVLRRKVVREDKNPMGFHENGNWMLVALQSFSGEQHVVDFHCARHILFRAEILSGMNRGALTESPSESGIRHRQRDLRGHVVHVSRFEQ